LVLFCLVVPVILLGFTFSFFGGKMTESVIIETPEKDVTSPLIYNGNLWNYALEESNVNKELTKELLEKIIANEMDLTNPKETIPFNFYETLPPELQETIPSNLNKTALTDINGGITNQIVLTNYSTIEMNLKIGKEQRSFPYYISSFNINSFNDSYLFEIYSNDTMTHGLPVTINTLSNSVLSMNGINENIITRSHPYSHRDLSYMAIEALILFMIIVCITLVVSLFGPMIVKEKDLKLLKQLNLSGITNKSYYCASFISNYVILYLLSAYIIFICALFGLEVFRQAMSIAVMLVFLVICCFTTLLFQYTISYGFRDESISYLIFFLLNFLPPFLTLYECFTIELEGELDELNVYKGEWYKLVVTAYLPMISIPNAIYRMMKVYIFRDITHEKIDFSIIFKCNKGRGFLYLLIGNIFGAVCYLALLFYLNHSSNTTRSRAVKEIPKKTLQKNIMRLKELDEDVYKEYQRVTNVHPQEKIPKISIPKDSKIIDDNETVGKDYNDSDSRENMIIKNEVHDENSQNEKSIPMPIRVVNVGKEHTSSKFISDASKTLEIIKKEKPIYGEYHHAIYGSGLAVTSLKDVSLGINSCECFGLIGPNGSGKSSLLNIITYNNLQTVGQVYYDDIENINIKEDHLMLGYCPQNDILWETLTLYEHLVMFIYLRGYSRKESRQHAQKYMEFCRIEEHKNKYPHELSGGTRRKLCILIALICFSKKVLLDEPSSGMDPATRRYIWNVLLNYKRNEDSSIVLTTHSMEEAEFLCNRIGMLVNGELLAIGSPNHLKMKFGNTYSLEIQSTDVKVIDEMIKKDLPIMKNEDEVVCEFKSDKRIKYTFKITDNHSEIFRIMESYKTQGIVIDYSFCQTTLEDVFLKFAENQENQEM